MTTMTTSDDTRPPKPVESKLEKKERLAVEAGSAWAEYEANKKAVDSNMERLRALRLAQEAKLATDLEPPPKPKKKRAAHA